MKIRLLYLISDLHVGGACSLMINNAVELAKRGHHIQIVYFGSNDALLSRIQEHNLSITRLPYDGGFMQFFKVCQSLITFVRINSIDIIHGNLHLDIRFGFVASLVTGRPWVVTLHALRFAAMTYGSFKYRMFRRFEDLLLLRADKLIAVSGAVKNDQNGFLRRKAHVIYSGVPVFASAKASEAPRDNPLTILHVGRIDPVKNQRFTLKLGAALKAANLPFSLLIIGNGNGAYMKLLINDVKIYDIETEVVFAGAVNNLGDYYTNARYVIIPSHSESFGLVAAEAMQCGNVVIAANVPGLNELMVHGEDGFYFEPGNVDQAVKLIIELQNDPGRYSSISENAKRSFEQKFTIEKSVGELICFYQTLL